MPNCGIATSSSHNPGWRLLLTNAFMRGTPCCARGSVPVRLFLTNGRQEPLVGTLELALDFQPAVILQQPSEGVGCVRILEVHPDALAAFELDLFARHGGGNIAGRAEIARDQ